MSPVDGDTVDLRPGMSFDNEYRSLMHWVVFTAD